MKNNYKYNFKFIFMCIGNIPQFLVWYSCFIIQSLLKIIFYLEIYLFNHFFHILIISLLFFIKILNIIVKYKQFVDIKFQFLNLKIKKKNKLQVLKSKLYYVYYITIKLYFNLFKKMFFINIKISFKCLPITLITYCFLIIYSLNRIKILNCIIC